MTSKFDRIPAALSTLKEENYVTYRVELDIEVRQMWGQNGIEDEAISKISLAPGSSVPDGGSYTLRYTYCGKKYEEIGLRVHLGRLLKS